MAVLTWTTQLGMSVGNVVVLCMLDINREQEGISRTGVDHILKVSGRESHAGRKFGATTRLLSVHRTGKGTLGGAVEL